MLFDSMPIMSTLKIVGKLVLAPSLKLCWYEHTKLWKTTIVPFETGSQHKILFNDFKWIYYDKNMCCRNANMVKFMKT